MRRTDCRRSVGRNLDVVTDLAGRSGDEWDNIEIVYIGALFQNALCAKNNDLSRKMRPLQTSAVVARRVKPV
jgi:hypothetical protein